MKSIIRLAAVIAFLVTHLVAPAFGLSLKEYFELKKKSSLLVQWYLSGVVDGYTLANTWVPSDQRLFCMPGKLALQPSNLQQLTEEYYEKQSADFKSDYFDKSFSFEFLAISALVSTFPCETTTKTKK